jgi:hypothetical protein
VTNILPVGVDAVVAVAAKKTLDDVRGFYRNLQR